MEEILKKILEGQQILFNEIKELKSGQQELSNEIKDFKSGQQRLEEEVSTIKQKMGTKTQQRENTDIIKALLHNQEEFNAQLETLALNTISKAALENVATKEDIGKLDARFQVLNARLFNQETEITQLKAVK